MYLYAPNLSWQTALKTPTYITWIEFCNPQNTIEYIGTGKKIILFSSHQNKLNSIGFWGFPYMRKAGFAIVQRGYYGV